MPADLRSADRATRRYLRLGWGIDVAKIPADLRLAERATRRYLRLGWVVDAAKKPALQPFCKLYPRPDPHRDRVFVPIGISAEVTTRGAVYVKA